MFNFFNKKYVTAYFRDGLLYKISPKVSDLYTNRELFYDARFIVVDGKKYDLESLKSIESIQPPKRFAPFTNTPLGITGNLVYVLRMKASNLKQKGLKEEAFSLLKTATELMPISEVLWTRYDYLRYARWLAADGNEEAARTATRCVDELLGYTESPKPILEQVDKINMQNAKSLGTDLVEAEFYYNCCDECTKYRGRYYSISGKDKRFPKKPNIENCTCSGLSFSPVIFGISKPLVSIFLNREIDIIKYSNRPFVVERFPDEIKIAEKLKKVEEEEREIDEAYAPFGQRLSEIQNNNREQYAWICEYLPELAPKSLGGYTRMKNSGSKNFDKLVQAAKEKGKDITFSDRDRKELATLKDLSQKYQKVKIELYYKKK